MGQDDPITGDETYDTGFRDGALYLDAVTPRGARLSLLEVTDADATTFCAELTDVLRSEPLDFDPNHDPTLTRLQDEGFVETADELGSRRALLVMQWYYDSLPPFTEGEVVTDGLGFSVQPVPTTETRDRAEKFVRDLRRFGDGIDAIVPDDIERGADGEVIEIVPPEAIDPENRAEYAHKMTWLFRLRSVLGAERSDAVRPE